MQLRSEFSSETVKARKEWENVFKALEGKKENILSSKNTLQR